MLVRLGAIIVGGFYLVARLTGDEPVAYANIEDHFKYGSFGGERESGIPILDLESPAESFSRISSREKISAWPEYDSIGFLYETGKDLPIGVSKRNTQGIDRVFLNCAVCHAGSLRERRRSAHHLHRHAFEHRRSRRLPTFHLCLRLGPALQRRSADARNGGDRALTMICSTSLIMRYYAIPLMRERLMMLKDRFRFIDWEPDQGPGRTDTFNPAKTLVNYPLEKMETREIVGVCDLPSIWLQGPRRDRDMQLHWDGNQRKMEERNKNASFGTGAFPPTIDLVKRCSRIEELAH